MSIRFLSIATLNQNSTLPNSLDDLQLVGDTDPKPIAPQQRPLVRRNSHKPVSPESQARLSEFAVYAIRNAWTRKLKFDSENVKPGSASVFSLPVMRLQTIVSPLMSSETMVSLSANSTFLTENL